MRSYSIAFMLALVFLLSGCSGGKPADISLEQGAVQYGLADPPPREISLIQLEQDIADAETPPGVDPAVYDKLKEQLIRDIRARGTSKITSLPPIGLVNKVKDLKLFGNEADGFLLRWTYLNLGDLNLDGLVSINDLTPIGLYFDESADGSNWIVACRADGNKDGLVTINDITPIGQNYLNYIVGYNIYGSANEDGPWAFIGDMALPDAPNNAAFELSYFAPTGGYWYYQIRPFDDEGVEGEPSQVSRATVEPPLLELGADAFELEEVIGPLGGTISGMLGTLGMIGLEFPPGAVEEELAVRIGINDGSFEPGMGELKSPIVAVDTGGVRSFREPIHIQVPFDRSDYGKAIVPYIVDDMGKLHLIDLIETEKDFVATFETYQLHPHLIWIVQAEFADLLGLIRSSAFAPVRDGMQVVNTGSMWHPGGECFGMTAFANWYFNTGKTWSEGDFYPRFMYNVPIYGGLSGQRIICTRAFTSIAKEWPTYWDNFVGPQGGLNDAQRFNSICNGIQNAGHPVLVDLRHENGTGGAHSVLAYAYSASGLFVYDPNAPGVERFIQYNSQTGSFDPYSGYDSIRYSGSGALWVDEPYQGILDDAAHQFADNGFATINITSHGTGQDVPIGSVLVTGTIESTVELVDELTISVNSVWQSLSIPPSGNFSATVSIGAGVNTFYFSTYATRLNGSEVFIPHDLGGGAFFLNGV